MGHGLWLGLEWAPRQWRVIFTLSSIALEIPHVGPWSHPLAVCKQCICILKRTTTVVADGWWEAPLTWHHLDEMILETGGCHDGPALRGCSVCAHGMERESVSLEPGNATALWIPRWLSH